MSASNNRNAQGGRDFHEGADDEDHANQHEENEEDSGYEGHEQYLQEQTDQLQDKNVNNTNTLNEHAQQPVDDNQYHVLQEQQPNTQQQYQPEQQNYNNNNNNNNNYPSSQPMDSNGYEGQGQENGENQGATTIAEQIREDIQEKIRNFEEFLQGKSEEQVLNVRMHQLALAKVLVFTHGASQFKLVEAHTKLGVAYLNYKCYEQAIDHLTMALKKNGNLFNEEKASQGYHAEILTQLGKCYLEVGSYEDALELLTKASELHRTVSGENDLAQLDTLHCIADCHTKIKDYDRAQQVIAQIYDIQTQHFDMKSQQVAFTMVENAKIFALRNDFPQAIEYQNNAIDTLIEIEYNKPEEVADLYQTLSGYFEKNNQTVDQVEALQKVKTLCTEIYGETDKRVIKVKRQISMIFLKNKQHEDSLRELLEIEDLEIKVYGENSVQVAKTLRIIGTVKVLTQGANEAQKYFAKAMKIFEENGMKNQVKDTKLKLQMARDYKGKRNDQPRQGNEYDY